MAPLLVLVGDDAAWVAAGSLGYADHVVGKEISFAVAVVGHLVVFDGVLVAVGTDAPDVHGEDFGVFVEGDFDDGLSTALRTKDLEDLAAMLYGAAVGGDGVGCVVEEDNSVRLGGVFGKFLLGGSADPVRDRVGLEGECGNCGKQKEDRCSGKAA